MSSYFPLIVACGLPFVGGIPSGLITRANMASFYNHLKKPTFTPPNWIFGPVWFFLYTTMGYSSYLIWKETGFEGAGKLPLLLYGTQLVLNWSWTPIFFGMHRMELACVEMITLYGAVGGCAYLFYPISKAASYLMFPYLAWLSFAVALNYRFWRNNQQADKKKN